MPTEHTLHIHCIDCKGCIDLPLTLLIDAILDARQNGITDPCGFLCDACALLVE